MVLTRALVQWFHQSRHSAVSPLDTSNDTAFDNHEAHRHAQSPAFGSRFPGILSSLLQTQFRSRSSVTDHTAASPMLYSPLYEFLVRPSVPTLPLASELASLLSRLPFVRPSLQHAVQDTAPTAAISSAESESIVRTNPPVRVEPPSFDWQMFPAERRHADHLHTVPRPLPTFASLRQCVLYYDFTSYKV